MGTILPKVSSNLSKMWNRILNLEQSLFPDLKESLRIEEFSSKESKLIRILDFAEIEKYIVNTSPTNTPKSREQIARAFIAKSVYNFQTTSDLIDRLHIDRTLRIICGWRYTKDIPSEATFSRAFDELRRGRSTERSLPGSTCFCSREAKRHWSLASFSMALQGGEAW